MGANGYSDTSRSTPYFNISSPYPPYTPDFPNAEIAPPPLTHQATLIYGAPASNHQPIWEYRVTHPLSPPRSKFVFPQVPNTHPHAIPNAYSYSIFPAHLAPFIPCPFSRTQPLREAPTLRVSSSDEVLVSRQRAGLAKQRLVTQGSVAMNKQEQKSVLKLFKETPLEERGMWPLEVSTFCGIVHCTLTQTFFTRLSADTCLSFHWTKRDPSGYRRNLELNMAVQVPSVQHWRPRYTGYSMSFEVQCLHSRWTRLGTL